MQNQNESFQRARAGAGHWGKACNKKETAVLKARSRPCLNARFRLTMPEITELSDQALLSQTKLLVQKERSLHVQVLRHLREIEARQLYFSEGYASLFDYAVRGLGYSKGAAFRRIKAMRLCRDEPETLEKIKSGRLSLCAASQLQSFFEKQKKEVVRLKNDLKKASESGLAVQSIKQRGELELKGAAGSALREKNKTLAPEQGCLQSGSAPGPEKSGGSALGSKGKPAGSAPGLGKNAGSAPGLEENKPPRGGMAARPAQQTGSALGSKGKPASSAPGLGKNAGSAPGLEENKPPRGGMAARPAQQTGSAPGFFWRERAAPQRKRAPGPGGSRYIPAEVKRLVWARDQGRCSYVNPKTGRRCGSRYMIQMDHIKPYSLGGLSTKENMRLLCAGHNRFRARQTFPASRRLAAPGRPPDFA